MQACRKLCDILQLFSCNQYFVYPCQKIILFLSLFPIVKPMDIYKTTIFFVIYILPSFETCFLENYRTEIGKRLYTLAWINVNRLDFTSVSFSRPARPAACRRLTENTSRDPEERSEGRTEGRKESTIRVETQRGTPHLRLRLPPLLRPSRKSSKILILGKQSRSRTASNRLFLSFFFFFWGGMPNIFDLPLSLLERSSIEEGNSSFVYELKKK